MSEFRLTSEQQEVVDGWGTGLAVLAGAGCGKTTTLVAKCIELLKRDPESRFAAVSFTERSASDLKAKLSERIPSFSRSGHWVMTIHGLCAAILREFPREAGLDGEETMLSEAETRLLWEQARSMLWLEDALPEDVSKALDVLTARETPESVNGLLDRCRQLRSFGIGPALVDSRDPVSRALGVASFYLWERYERLKRRRGSLDFDDLERGAAKVLEFPDARRQLQARFHLIMVDEFQDTNPVQARILSQLAKFNLSNLCVVGDPKQSIYRFRDADVSVFEDFCRRMPSRKSLTWNFRSRPGIIEVANQVCAPAFASGAMPYEPLEPKRSPAPDADENGSAVVQLEVEAPADLARWIVAEVKKGVKLHEMALLLRKIRGNERWLQALAAAGIPVAVGSGGLFWEDPRVHELVSLLRWWQNPSHALSGAVFLRAPWVGIEDERLDAWVKEDPTWATRFFESHHPLAEALAPLRGRCVRPGELLLALCSVPSVENVLGAQLLGLWHRAEELSMRGHDFFEVVAAFSRSVQEGRRERDVPPPKGEGQLTVLTLHGAKGLEFNHVLLVDFPQRARIFETPLLYWDREKGVFLGGRDSDGDRTHNDDPLEQEWKARERAKEIAESMRVLYVAMTRAKERMVLVFPKPSERAAKMVEKQLRTGSIYEKDYWRAWIEEANLKVPQITGAGSGEQMAGSLSVGGREATAHRKWSAGAPERVRARHSVTEWNLFARCPRAYALKMRGVANDLPDLPEKSRAANSPSVSRVNATELGTRVHAALQREDAGELAQIEQEVGEETFRAQSVELWWKSSNLMKGAGQDSETQVWTELAFEVPIGRQVLVGAMDRVVRSNGVWKIVDFKVSSHRRTADQLRSLYGAQLALYAEGLRRLEPKTAHEVIETWIVLITPFQTEEIRIELSSRDSGYWEAFAEQVQQVIAGADGEARPSDQCRACAWKKSCALSKP